nr:ABC transporter substrate-binding protein [Bdellovibrio sp. HM001]
MSLCLKPLLILLPVFLGCETVLAKWKSQPVQDIVYQGMTEDFVPFNYLENNKIQGYSTDVVREAFKRAGLKTELTLWPWARAYSAALQKKKHYVFSTSRSEEREKLFKWVGPIAKDSVYLAALSTSNFKPAEDYRSFKKYSVGGQFDDYPIQVLQKEGFKVSIYRSEDERMETFKKGRIDLDIVTDGSQKTYEKRWNIKYKRLAFMYATDYWMAFHISTPEVVIQSLNKALEDMKKDGTLQKIADKYL